MANKKTNATPDIRIVILQRGFVYVGRFEQKGSHCSLSDGYNVRRWGTTRGLGELASDGPIQNKTVLDPVPLVEFHELTVIATIRCNPGKWEQHVR